jgi:hypothetical protein
MPNFIENGASIQELISLNLCRLHLRVTTLADITESSGAMILQDAWTGNNWFTLHRIDTWPVIPRPTAAHWNIWRTYIKKGFITRGLRLHSPLKPWINIDPGWVWFFSPSQGTLLQKHSNTWYAFPRVSQRGHRIHFSSIGQTINSLELYVSHSETRTLPS